MSKHEDSIADDLLHGAKEIADFIGVHPRKIFYYVEKKKLPVTKLGNLIIGSKSVLRRHFTEKAAQ